LPMKSSSFDINHDLKSSDISWSVRETAKIFEQNLLPTKREHYVWFEERNKHFVIWFCL